MNYTDRSAIGSALGEVTDEDLVLLNKVTTWLRQSEGSDAETNWAIEAEEDYNFYGGDQDTAEVLEKLANAKRPALVYNEVKPKVDVVIGLAGQNRQLPSAFPVEHGDEAIVEIANGAIKFFRRESKLATNEITCFEHTVKSGRSLLHFYVDDENPFEPAIKTRFIHGRNFKLDPRSVEYDMSDARFLFIDFWFDAEEIKAKFPDFDPEKVTQLQSSDGSSPMFYNAVENTYRVTECWYKATEKVTWVVNPVTNQPEKVSKADYEKMKARLAEGININGQVLIDRDFKGVEKFATVYKYFIFSNYYVFAKGTSKHRWEGFPDVLFGGFKHDKENRWFGLITMMKDPQRGINTMHRQMQHLLQTSPKGILVHEVGAILDIESYEKNSASPNYHMEVAQGALAKVKFTEQPTISPVYGQLMSEDKQFVKDVSGVQNDTLGIQTYSREPGITTQLRQGQNIAILYIMLENFKNSRLLATKILFSFVQQYITTERLIRIEGPDGQQLLQMINSQGDPKQPGFNDISIGKYDFFVEEGIETVNSRNSLAQMLIDIAHNNPGSVPPDLIVEYSGAPFSVVQKIKAYTAQMQQVQQQAEQQKLQHEKEMEEMRLESQKYIAMINNLAKLVTSDKKIEGDLVKTLITGIQNANSKSKGEE